MRDSYICSQVLSSFKFFSICLLFIVVFVFMFVFIVVFIVVFVFMFIVVFVFTCVTGLSPRSCLQCGQSWR